MSDPVLRATCSDDIFATASRRCVHASVQFDSVLLLLTAVAAASPVCPAQDRADADARSVTSWRHWRRNVTSLV